jgi:hypothetical protein
MSSSSNTPSASAEHRRHERRPVRSRIEVTDTMSGDIIGHLGNVSEDGLMLVSQVELSEEAIYQFNFTLHGRNGASALIEVGAICLWCSESSLPGTYWSGFKIVDISPENYAEFIASFAGEDVA